MSGFMAESNSGELMTNLCSGELVSDSNRGGFTAELYIGSLRPNPMTMS